MQENVSHQKVKLLRICLKSLRQELLSKHPDIHVQLNIDIICRNEPDPQTPHSVTQITQSIHGHSVLVG